MPKNSTLLSSICVSHDLRIVDTGLPVATEEFDALISKAGPIQWYPLDSPEAAAPVTPVANEPGPEPAKPEPLAPEIEEHPTPDQESFSWQRPYPNFRPGGSLKGAFYLGQESITADGGRSSYDGSSTIAGTELGVNLCLEEKKGCPIASSLQVRLHTYSAETGKGNDEGVEKVDRVTGHWHSQRFFYLGNDSWLWANIGLGFLKTLALTPDDNPDEQAATGGKLTLGPSLGISYGVIKGSDRRFETNLSFIPFAWYQAKSARYLNLDFKWIFMWECLEGFIGMGHERTEASYDFECGIAANGCHDETTSKGSLTWLNSGLSWHI